MRFLAFVAAAVTAAVAVDVDTCPGYKASKVETKGSSLSAELTLAGNACNAYGEDVKTLKLQVDYETETRIHVKIIDPTRDRYEIPDSVFPRPTSKGVSSSKAAIKFEYTSSPFSFSIVRAKSGEVLFSTAKHPIVFEPQYLRLATNLPANPNIYGLGEHTDPFRLPTYNYTRTLWSRDAYGVANGTNLYGNHPVYFEHRTTGTHGVLFLNSNGLDVKINSTSSSSPATLEYNSLGGVFDFYFLAGSTTDPVELARQYAELAHTPAEVPYWSLGFHQCRFGYKDYIDVANVITNYSAAKIPLETMWTDIDYMDRRRVFTLDPNYFPMSRVREIVDYLHSHDQQYILMVDPAVAYLPNETTPSAYTRGTQAGIWLKAVNGTDLKAIVWPGETVYPDWFNNKTQAFWTSEFERLFNPENGVDLDGAWIDMNEPASFCNYPCTNPAQQAIEQGLPPNRTSPPPDPNAPIFGRSAPQPPRVKRAYHGSQENLREPAYKIANAAGEIGSRTADTDAIHANGLVEYDTHNLYGTMMSSATRNAMEARRPGKRTLIITRSTFAGAGKDVGKWLGDNLSTWWHYRVSIAGMLGFASVYQLPMVGSDICGFGGNTTETLCARWAMLGAFYPFMRNHNGDTSISQEFYLWPTVAVAARNAIDIRYRLLDYIYTAFHAAHTDGTPILHPLFYKYPKDANTFGRDLQFFYGDSILVSPVTEENSTTVNAYIPKDTFYDFGTLAPVQGQGAEIAITANFTTMPLHIKSGAIIPMRVSGAMTTKALRKTDFELVVAPDSKGAASGSLYVDDGESITPKQTTELQFDYKKGKLSVNGHFGYALGVKLARVRIAGVSSKPKKVQLKSDKGGKKDLMFFYDSKSKVVEASLDIAFTSEFELELDD